MSRTADTIFALSSGAPPAAIAVVRVSGPAAGTVLAALAGRMPEPRVATLAALRGADGELLDRGLVLWFPGPASATGDDLLELHLHGGRAVVARVLREIGAMPGLRAARPGEFARRAFEAGRIDLTEAEGLADLLLAETEGQRRDALALAGGAVAREVREIAAETMRISALVEAGLDFPEEDDVAGLSDYAPALAALAARVAARLAAPCVERLREGCRVVIAGPPNAGKSTLLNALVEREAAIVAAQAGTTRDAIEVPIAIAGMPFVIVDTAGLRDTGDEIERIGIARARAETDAADIVLWLGDPDDAPAGAMAIAPKSDLGHAARPGQYRVSAKDGCGIAALLTAVADRGAAILSVGDEVSLRRRHQEALREVQASLAQTIDDAEPELVAERLRVARAALGTILGGDDPERVLDAIFSQLCIGK